MKKRVKVGDHVSLNCYDGNPVTGVVTRVGKERTESWKYLEMYQVKYDTPVLKNVRGAWIHIVMGQHLLSELDPCM